MIVKKYKVYQERPVKSIKMSEYNLQALVAVGEEHDAYDEAEIELRRLIQYESSGTFSIQEVFINKDMEEV